MADTKISLLPSASSVNLSDLFPVVQSGDTYKATILQIVSAFPLANYLRTDGSNSMAAPLNMGGNDILNVDAIYGDSGSGSKVSLSAQFRYLGDKDGAILARFVDIAEGFGINGAGNFGFLKSLANVQRTHTFQNANGTIAHLSDIPTVSGVYAPLAGAVFTGNVNGITPTELGYLTGITSSVQTQINGKQAALGFTAENVANKGAANGYVPLDASSLINSIYLPAYVDDVLEFANLASFPATGETGKIYIALNNNFSYRWSGSVYVQLTSASAVWGSISGTLSAQTDLQTALNAKQSDSTNLTSLSGLTYASASFVKMNASGTFALDTNTYITANQTITLSGDVSGSGTTAITVSVNKLLGNTIPANASVYLFNNGSGTLSWGNPSGSGTVTSVSVTTANGVSGTVATATTTPAITITLGAITPTSVVSTGILAGTNIAESSTSIRLGQSSAFNGTATKGTIIGQGSSATGINATVVGASSKAAQYGITVGSDNWTSTAPPNGVVMITNGATATKTSAQNCVVIAPNLYTFANAFGGVFIGNGINVTCTAPTNTANNSGVYIGEGVTHIAGIYAQAVVIGKDNNAQNSTGAVLLGSKIVTESGLQNSTVIGYLASSIGAQTQTTVVGFGAKAYLDATFGTAGSGLVAIGESAFSGAWRATAIGGYSQALAVSTSVLGYGGYANKSHCVVVGRGGYNDIANSVLLYGGLSGNNINSFYFGGASASWTNPAMPGSEVINMSSSLNAGTTYSKLFGISGRDANTSPTLTNTRGGHIRLVGGVSTGTALGGAAEIAVTIASGASSNTENAETVGIRVAPISTTLKVDIGTATTHQIGHYGVTPVVQPTTAITAGAFVANSSATINDSATYGGYTIGQISASLKALGLLA